jgi:integrase
VPVKVVSQRIGHADPAVTMQVYAHALDGDDATAAETTAAAIFGDR